MSKHSSLPSPRADGVAIIGGYKKSGPMLTVAAESDGQSSLLMSLNDSTADIVVGRNCCLLSAFLSSTNLVAANDRDTCLLQSSSLSLVTRELFDEVRVSRVVLLELTSSLNLMGINTASIQ